MSAESCRAVSCLAVTCRRSDLRSRRLHEIGLSSHRASDQLFAALQTAVCSLGHVDATGCVAASKPELSQFAKIILIIIGVMSQN